jgi:hypothetical protein
MKNNTSLNMNRANITNLEPAIKHFGTVKAIAELLGIHTMTVYQWKKSGIPVHRAIQLADLSTKPNKSFRAYDLLAIPELKNIK